MIYIAYAKDNSEMEESGRKIAEFQDCGAAIAACQRIVNRSLEECDSSQGAGDLFRQYSLFGEDAWIITDDPDCKFSAWEYAKQRCQELAAKKGT